MNKSERRQHVLSILRKRNRYQFGQPYAKSNLVGNSGCTDTSIQMIVLMALGKKVSLNLIRRRSGAPANKPMEAHEAIRALHSFGLQYEVRTGLSAGKMLTIARNKGPIILAEMYWAHPQWAGYTYAGRTLNGFASNGRRSVNVGYSKPLRRSGLTQWTFRSGHAVLIATDMWGDGQHWGIVRDPNHNSGARPERPAFDKVTIPQLRRMVNSWPGSSLALVPTRVVIK